MAAEQKVGAAALGTGPGAENKDEGERLGLCLSPSLFLLNLEGPFGQAGRERRTRGFSGHRWVLSLGVLHPKTHRGPAPRGAGAGPAPTPGLPPA